MRTATTMRAAAVAVALTLVVSVSPAVAAEVRDGVYTGQADVSSLPGVASVLNEVRLEVAGGGAVVGGSIRLMFPSEVEYEGQKRSLCVVIQSDFTASPLAITGTSASGDVPVQFGVPDGTCSVGGTYNLESQPAGFSVAFSDTTAIGTLTIPGNPPDVVNFRAQRGGVRGSTDTTTDAAADTTTDAIDEAILGIEEFFTGEGMQNPFSDTVSEIAKLRRCTDADGDEGDPRRGTPPGRCNKAFVRSQVNELLSRVKTDDPVKQELLESVSRGPLRGPFASAALLAVLNDPQGNALFPAIRPMLPILLELQKRRLSPDADEATSAVRTMTRLTGLLIAVDVKALGAKAKAGS